MTGKKKNRPHCTNHPERRARGTCVSCGVKLCKECALIVRGVYYCFSPACRPENITDDTTVQIEKTSTSQLSSSDTFWKQLVFRSAITISLCGLFFAVWALRELWYSNREISQLRSSRVNLLQELQSRNETIRTLSAASTVPQDTETTKNPVIPPPVKLVKKQSYSPLYSPPPSNSSYGYFHFANGPTNRKNVALTFDGGSFANVTDDILDTLSSRSVTATMFLSGYFMRKYPEVTRKIIQYGHECGNHTYNHPHLTTYATDRLRTTLPEMNPDVLREQLLRAEELFFKITGTYPVPLWRAPYGEYNRDICLWAKNYGYLHVGWRQGKSWRYGLDSNDWVPDSTTPGYHSPEDFLNKVIALSKSPPSGINGGIILMHLGTQRKEKTAQTHRILGTLIDTLRADGYRFIKVSEMVETAGIHLASLRERSHIQ